jgi:hypothetical protein
MFHQALKRAVFLMILAGCSFPITASGAPSIAPATKAKPPSETVTCFSPTQRFNFLPNGYAGSINYQFSLNCLEANFIVSAKAGQLMVLVLSSPGPTRFEIKSPDGISDGEPVGNGGVIFNKMLTSTGDYKIRISKSKMAEPWVGQIILTAVIQPNI